MVRDREPLDPVVAHAVVFGKDDVEGVPTQFQLAAEAQDDLAQSARLRHRRALGSNHYDEHGSLRSFPSAPAGVGFTEAGRLGRSPNATECAKRIPLEARCGFAQKPTSDVEIVVAALHPRVAPEEIAAGFGSQDSPMSVSQ